MFSPVKSTIPKINKRRPKYWPTGKQSEQLQISLFLFMQIRRRPTIITILGDPSKNGRVTVRCKQFAESTESVWISDFLGRSKSWSQLHLTFLLSGKKYM